MTEPGHFRHVHAPPFGMGESPLDKLAERPAMDLRECRRKRLAGPQRTTSQAVRPGETMPSHCRMIAALPKKVMLRCEMAFLPVGADT